MDLFDVAQACGRRWYVTVPAVLLTLFLAGLAYVSVPTVYQATSVVGLAPSPISGVDGNGIINNGGTIMLANLTAAGIASPEIAQAIEESTGATYFDAAVVVVPGGQMPMLNLVSSATDRATAVAAVELGQQRAEAELNRIQANASIPERAFGVIYEVSATPEVEVLQPGRGKMVAGIAGLGLIVSVLAGLCCDMALNRRQRRKQASGDKATSTGPQGDLFEHGAESSDPRAERRPAKRTDSSADPLNHRPAHSEERVDSEALELRSLAETSCDLPSRHRL